MQIEMTGISCHFGSTPAVDDIDLKVEKGEFLALLGPSGSGKTTLLRAIAGLEQPEAGSLTIDGRDALHLPPNKRQIGFVFQNYALFRHMNVARNIAFGLQIRPRRERPPKAEINRRVEELLDLVQLSKLGRRYPHELSGGQRQRVALARALAIEPSILLLDEPFGALDAQVRAELRIWLKSLHQRLGITTIFVTHDQEEALELADRVIIMRAGKIQQEGTPVEIYRHPATPFIYSFLGTTNKLDALAADGTALITNSAGQRFTVSAPHPLAGGVQVYFRPHHVQITADPNPQNAGTALIRDVSAIGARARITLDFDGTPIIADLEREAWETLRLSPGDSCHWQIRSAHFYKS